MKKIVTIFLVLVLIVGACNHSPKRNNAAGGEILYQPAYAQGFYLEQCGDEKILHVFNPWQGARDMELQYHLYPRDKKLNDTVATMNYIPVPLRRVVCLSSTHVALIDCLQQTATIAGVSGIGYIRNDTVRSRFAQGLVRDVGYETLLSYETIVAMQPDVVFAYGINGEMSAVTGKLNEMGVRVVYLADYLEENLLGKSEYMVAMAAFYNRETDAIANFTTIVDEYNALVEKAKDVSIRPRVIFNAPWRDTWYMPGEENYMNKLLHEAGAEAIGLSTGRNSKPLSLEAAYTYALQADYWLHPNAMRSLQELRNADSRFANTQAFASKKVYNNTRRFTSGGGSDFWESGVVNPHIVLSDLIYIFHPEILPEHELVYYEQLK